MRKFVFLFLFLFMPFMQAILARAHDYPITHVDVSLRIEPEMLFAHIHSNSVFWEAELLGSTVPLAAKWPEPIKRHAEQIINTFFVLAVDSSPILGHLTSARLVEEPFPPSQSFVEYEMRYSLPPNGKALSGVAQFFKDYWETEIAAHGTHADLGHLKEEPNKNFKTQIRIAGFHDYVLDIPIETRRFTIDLTTHRVPPVQYAKDGFQSGFLSLNIFLFTMIFLLGALLSLPPLKTGLWAGGAFTLLSLGAFLCPPIGWAQNQTIIWSLILIATLPALVRTPPAVWALLISLLGIPWGMIWNGEYHNTEWLLGGGGIAHVAFWLGRMGLIFSTLTILLVSFWAYRKRQQFLTESMASAICRTHARFAAFFIAGLAILKLLMNFSR